MIPQNPNFIRHLEAAKRLGTHEYDISPDDVQELIEAVSNMFKLFLETHSYSDRGIKALRTKFRDAGRRSPPWSATSSRVPGRPQDGADGDRRKRWEFSHDHKFYADEVNATLVDFYQDLPQLP